MASMFASNTDFNDLLDDGHFNFGGGNCSVEELFNPHVSSSQSGTSAQSGGLLRPRKNSIIEGRRLSFSFSPGSSSLDFAAFDYWLSADTNPSSSTNPGSSSSGSGSLTGTSPYQPLYYRRLSTAAIQPPSFLNFGGLTSPSISRSPSPSPVSSIIHTPGHSEYSPEEHSAMDLDSTSSTNSSSSPPGLEYHHSGGLPLGGQIPLDPADYFFSGELAVEVQQPIAVSGDQPTPAGAPTAVFKQTICASPKTGGAPTASLQQYQFPAPAAAAAAAALQGLPSLSAQTLFSLEESNPAEFRKAVIDACEKIFSGEGPFTAPATMLPKGPSLLPASGQLSLPGQVPLLPAPAKLPINSNAVLPAQPPTGSSGPSAPAPSPAKKAPTPTTPNGNGSKTSSSKKPKQPKPGKQEKQDKKVHLDLRRTKTSRLKWSSELQDIFVATVERLGITAVPSTILEEMNVSGLTRENVASHLQKYRQHCIRGTMGRMQKKKKAEQAKLAAAAAMKQALAPAPAPAPSTSTSTSTTQPPPQQQLPKMPPPSAGPTQAEVNSVAPAVTSITAPNLVAPALASLAEVTPAPLPLDALQQLQSQPASSEQPSAGPAQP